MATSWRHARQAPWVLAAFSSSEGVLFGGSGGVGGGGGHKNVSWLASRHNLLSVQPPCSNGWR